MNRVLIDTQVLIWWLSSPYKIKDRHKRLLEDSNNQVDVSICSLWEIVIKKSIGRLSFEYDIKKVLIDHGFTLLNLSLPHLDQYLNLPCHHYDPFDRMIIAQALSEKLPIISYDKIFSSYEILII